MPKRRITDEEWRQIQAAYQSAKAEKAAQQAKEERQSLIERYEAAKLNGTPEELIELLRQRPHGEKLAFGYRRCSSEGSRKSGMGLETQYEFVEAYAKLVMLENPEVQWGGWALDEAVSAFRVKFFHRPAAREFKELLRPGDHLIFPNIERFTRLVFDGLGILEFCEKNDVKLHFAQERVDVSTAVGKLLFTIIASVAEHWSRITSERMILCKAQQRRKGLPVGGIPPIGFKVIGEKYHRAWAFDAYERSVMGEIVRVKHTIGVRWTWNKISDWIETALCQKDPNRPAPTFYRDRREWHPKRCKKAYYAEIKIQAVLTQAREAGLTQITPSKIIGVLRGYATLEAKTE